MNISITVTGIILQKRNLCFVTENMSLTTKAEGEGNGNPLQYSCLENSMDGGAWWATVHGVTTTTTTTTTKAVFKVYEQYSVAIQFSFLF